MLKKRLIATLILKDKWVVQSIGFNRFLPVGSLEVSVECLNRWGIDEISILDIQASAENKPNFSMIASASKKSQTPLSVGGGIRSIEDMITLIKAGADKLIINTEFLKNPDIIKEGARYFGNQCMVVSIDVKKDKQGKYQIFNRNINKGGLDLREMLILAEYKGAGELLINSVDRDGMKNGYDLELYNKIKEIVSIPIIFSGGVGSVKHILDGISGGLDAPAVGNFFHFTEMSVIYSKDLLSHLKIDVRRDTYAKYSKNSLNMKKLSIKKQDDEILNSMRFQKIPDEII